jgi:hypothetical protein
MFYLSLHMARTAIGCDWLRLAAIDRKYIVREANEARVAKFFLAAKKKI